MRLAQELNRLEQYYFFDRQTGGASRAEYIDSNTWRGFRSNPRVDNAPSDALKDAFTCLVENFETFLQCDSNLSKLTRELFDEFHAGQVEYLYDFLRTLRAGVTVLARAMGDFYECAYGSYCKVINLAHTHWCFRPQPNGIVQYPPAHYPGLRSCIHVPLDEKVLGGVGSLIDKGDLPHFKISRGGMGSVKTRYDYIAIQNYLRNEADKVKSTNFPGTTVSPLSFEGFWTL